MDENQYDVIKEYLKNGINQWTDNIAEIHFVALQDKTDLIDELCALFGDELEICSEKSDDIKINKRDINEIIKKINELYNTCNVNEMSMSEDQTKQELYDTLKDQYMQILECKIKEFVQSRTNMKGGGKKINKGDIVKFTRPDFNGVYYSGNVIDINEDETYNIAKPNIPKNINPYQPRKKQINKYDSQYYVVVPKTDIMTETDINANLLVKMAYHLRNMMNDDDPAHIEGDGGKGDEVRASEKPVDWRQAQWGEVVKEYESLNTSKDSDGALEEKSYEPQNELGDAVVNVEKVGVDFDENKVRELFEEFKKFLGARQGATQYNTLDRDNVEILLSVNYIWPKASHGQCCEKQLNELFKYAKAGDEIEFEELMKGLGVGNEIITKVVSTDAPPEIVPETDAQLLTGPNIYKMPVQESGDCVFYAIALANYIHHNKKLKVDYPSFKEILGIKLPKYFAVKGIKEIDNWGEHTHNRREKKEMEREKNKMEQELIKYYKKEKDEDRIPKKEDDFVYRKLKRIYNSLKGDVKKSGFEGFETEAEKMDLAQLREQATLLRRISAIGVYVNTLPESIRSIQRDLYLWISWYDLRNDSEYGKGGSQVQYPDESKIRREERHAFFIEHNGWGGQLEVDKLGELLNKEVYSITTKADTGNDSYPESSHKLTGDRKGNKDIIFLNLVEGYALVDKETIRKNIKNIKDLTEGEIAMITDDSGKGTRRGKSQHYNALFITNNENPSLNIDSTILYPHDAQSQSPVTLEENNKIEWTYGGGGEKKANLDKGLRALAEIESKVQIEDWPEELLSYPRMLPVPGDAPPAAGEAPPPVVDAEAAAGDAATRAEAEDTKIPNIMPAPPENLTEEQAAEVEAEAARMKQFLKGYAGTIEEKEEKSRDEDAGTTAGEAAQPAAGDAPPPVVPVVPVVDAETAAADAEVDVGERREGVGDAAEAAKAGEGAEEEEEEDTADADANAAQAAAEENAAAISLQRNWRWKQGRDAAKSLQEAKAKRKIIRGSESRSEDTTVRINELAGSSTKIIDTESLKNKAMKTAQNKYNELLSEIDNGLQNFNDNTNDGDLKNLLELLIRINWENEKLRKISEFYKEYKKNIESGDEDKDGTLNGKLYELLGIEQQQE